MNTEIIWKNFASDLRKFILSRVKDADAAEDILQDVFIKIHLNLDKLKSESKLNSWLFQITRNAIIDFFRQTKTTDLKSDVSEEIDSTQDYLEFDRCLKRFVNELPDKYREALVKTEFGSLSQKEFAAELGISYSGAKSRVQRAKEELKDLFIQCCGTSKKDKNGKPEFKDPKDCTC